MRLWIRRLGLLAFACICGTGTIYGLVRAFTAGAAWSAIVLFTGSLIGGVATIAASTVTWAFWPEDPTGRVEGRR